MANCPKCSCFYSPAVRPFCDLPDCPVAAEGMTADDADDYLAAEMAVDADWLGDDKY